MANDTGHRRDRPNCSTPEYAPLVVLGAFLIAYLSMTDVVLAGKKPWYRYENGHFVAYSNASEKKTRKLLLELEIFRAAFVQIGNIVIPETAPKTRVIIVRSKSEFSRLKTSKNVAGFAQPSEEGTILVLPAAGDPEWAKSAIQHEYGHALLDFKKFRYPRWYEEGFSEIVSTTELTENGQAFKLGGLPLRLRSFTQTVFDWDALVADDFAPHTIVDAAIASGAYAQAWLLAHYATLGSPANRTKLQNYFDMIRAGAPSSDAFIKAFGVSAEELWKSELMAYLQRMPAYTIQFASGSHDPEFIRTEARSSEYQPLLDFFEQRSVAVWRGKSPRKPLALLTGQWSRINMTETCKDTKQLSVNEDDNTITIERFFRNADDESRSRTFVYQPAGKRAYTLAVIEGLESNEENIPWRLEMRGKELLCFSRTDWGAPCEFIWQKCAS